MKFLQHHYKGPLYFLCGIGFAFFLSQNSLFESFLLHLKTFGYIGAFIAGMLFVSTFTIATSVLILIKLSHILPPLQLSIVAAIGATIANYLIFHFMNKKITYHFHKYLKKHKTKHGFAHLHKHAHFFLPFLGALIIASPLPDEIGIFLLSLFKMRAHQFVAMSFVLKFVGIFLVVSGLHYTV